jgi:ATP adenylyltransferase
MNFDEVLQFVERDMRMSHVYQPVMLRELLSRNGRATVGEIARALLNEDRSQIEYYSEITKNKLARFAQFPPATC